MSDAHGISVAWRPADGIVLSLGAERAAGTLGIGLSVNQAQRLARELSHALIASGVMRRSEHRPVRCSGRKKNYSTESEARAAHSQAGWRVRVYRCESCSAFHAANADKGAAKGSP